MPRRKAPLAAIALGASTVAVILVVMWVAGVGFFSAPEHAAGATTTAALAEASAAAAVTRATPAPKLPAFNPAKQSESKGYFVSLWTSTKAAQAAIRKEERAVKSDPSVDNQTTLVGLEQNCMSVLGAYNAAALAIASKAFRGAGLPAQIPPKECSP